MRAAHVLVLAALICPVAGCASTPSPSTLTPHATPARPFSGQTLTLGTTTTTQDSGLLDALLPAFENDTGIHVRPIVKGSGEILATASRGDVDVLLVHSRAAELAFVASGEGTNRSPVMFNRFFLVGSPSDAAGTARASNASDAFKRIYQNQSTVAFVSRGDESGTDVREKSIWARAGYDASTFPSSWYKQTGSGQGQTLLVADQSEAYALSDEATWAQMRAHGQLVHLQVTFESDATAFKNPYGVTPVNATRHPGVREDLADAFASWVRGPRGQGVIASYTVGGVQVFFPDATDPKA